jgi:arylsulfatase A-like enzyme
VLVPDLVVRGRLVASHSLAGVLFYLASAAFMAVLWYSWFNFLATHHARRPWLTWPLLVACALLVPPLVVATLAFHASTGTELSPAFVEVTLQNPKLALSLTRGEMGVGTWMAGLSGMALAIFVQRRLIARPLPTPHVWVLVAFGLLASVVVLDFYGPRRPPSADLFAVRTAVLATLNLHRDRRRLPVPQRAVLSPVAPTTAPDVLLVVHESLSARHWAAFNPEAQSGRELVDLLARHADHAAAFRDCKAAAGGTTIALAALLTGLEPDASARQFAQAPLLWHWARSAGYRTALFSSQECEALFFPAFFLGSDRPEVVEIAADYEAPRVNAEGIDERFVVDSALRFFRQSPRDRPRFAMVQFNSTHVPCWAPDLEKTRFSDWAGRCRAAASYVGRLTAELMEGVDLEHTLVIVIADHGEATDRVSVARPSLRPDSMEEVIFSIPLIIHLPKDTPGVAAQWGERLLEASRKPVASIDVVPTVLDVWGRWPQREVDLPLVGRSLIEDLGGPRALVATNTGELRAWSPERMLVYYGSWKWLADEARGLKLYDLAKDPGETSDLSGQAPQEVREVLDREEARRPGLHQLLDTIRKKQR